MILKGTQIDSGSIIGAESVVAHKKIPHNSSWGGNPCRKIKDDIFWDGACVHNWDNEMTELSYEYERYIKAKKKHLYYDEYIYQYDENVCVDFDEIDRNLMQASTSMEKLEYLIKLHEYKEKNRFVHL